MDWGSKEEAEGTYLIYQQRHDAVWVRCDYFKVRGCIELSVHCSGKKCYQEK